MYIQLTTRCNMRCAHCCFSCTKRGEDMSMDIFTKAVKIGQGGNQVLCIGGGEPTLHPMFWDMLQIARNAYYQAVWVTTNGKLTKDAVKLAEMAREGLISCQLSNSQYHEPIDQKVTDAFANSPFGPISKDRRLYYTAGHTKHDLRMVSGELSGHNIVATGRGRNIYNAMEKCGMDNCPIVEVSGRVRRCLCEDSPIIGHVAKGYRLRPGLCGQKR